VRYDKEFTSFQSMPYYKVIARSFDTKEEKWIAFKEANIYKAMMLAYQLCAQAENPSYALEQTLTLITQDEYINFLVERYLSRPSNI
jgi:hypothetical protein